MKTIEIELYTDGACSGNPGVGGWSCIRYDKETNTIRDAWIGKDDQFETTNNRMELRGLLKGLELATTKYKDCFVTIYSDSLYVVKTFNEWITSWAGNNWTNSKKELVKNFDLIKQLYEYKKIDFPNFQILKVPGHAHNIGNELADAYATSQKFGDASKLAKIIKENDITLAIE